MEFAVSEQTLRPILQTVIYEGRADVKSSWHRLRCSVPRRPLAVRAGHLFGREPMLVSRSQLARAKIVKVSKKVPIDLIVLTEDFAVLVL
jgi:hypothetical protein